MNPTEPAEPTASSDPIVAPVAATQASPDPTPPQQPTQEPETSSAFQDTPQAILNRAEKRIFIVLCLLLALSLFLAWYVSSSADHTLSI